MLASRMTIVTTLRLYLVTSYKITATRHTYLCIQYYNCFVEVQVYKMLASRMPIVTTLRLYLVMSTATRHTHLCILGV